MASWHSSCCQRVLPAFLIFVSAIYVCFKMREYLLFPIILAAKGIAVPIMGAVNSKSQPLSLRFSASGTFQLSVFEDLHYGEGKIKSSISLPKMEELADPPECH